MSLPSQRRAASGPRSAAAHIAGRYLVENEIAAGGMAVVYRVVDQSSGRRLALKRLKDQRAGEDAAALFEREYHVLRRLRHPTLVEVYDYGIDERAPYYTMELLEGQTLHDLAPLGHRDACRYLRDVASSLALLHSRRLVHRDVSSRNVVRTPGGRCKLLDFGALAPFGVSTQVVGTPPFTAPEVLSGVPLDQRIDLYSLGALGYFLLTRRHAFPSRRFSDLLQPGRQRPQPPSALVAGVPSALDDLLLSLLSDKPLARPSTAAEVIDRLTAIADLEREEALGITESYLATPALSGRSAELRELRTALGAAQQGSGGLWLVEGGAGMGKSRLLTELVIEAQIAGAIVVQVDASMHRESLGVATALALRLLDAAPEQAAQAAAPYGGYLARLSRSLHLRLEATERMSTPGESDWRGRAQEALQGWLLAVAERRPVVLAIDDAHAADASSLALLAGLGIAARDHPLLVVATVTSGTTSGRPPELDRNHTALLRLRPLSAADVEALVRSLFGSAPNLTRLAEWLYDASSGNPLCIVELAHKLVRDQFIRYIGGGWTIPQEPPREPLPRSVHDAARARIEELMPAARELGMALSLSQGPISVGLVGLVAGECGLASPLGALEELVAQGVLHSHGDAYRFAQDSLRQELSDALSPERRARLHRCMGEWLLERASDDPGARINAGWHLLHGGEESRGAELLARQAVNVRDLDLLEGDVRATTAAMEAALAVYKKQNRSVYELIPLLFGLTSCGYFFDRRLAAAYGGETLVVLEQVCGLRIARRLRPFVGGFLAIALGLGLARLRFAVRRPRKLSYGFDLLLSYLVSSVAVLCGVATISLDGKRAEAIARVLEPFSALGARHTTSAIHRYCVLVAGMATENLAGIARGFAKLDRVFADSHQVTLLPEETRRAFQGGVLYALGVRESYRSRRTALEYAERLESLRVKVFEMIADQVRATYHAFRGEMAIAERWRERVELHAIQLGSSWQADLWWPTCTLHVACTVGDVVSLKNAAETFDQVSKEVPTFARYADIARASHAFWRGDLARALELSEPIEHAAHKSFVGWIAACGARAMILNAAGQHEHAARFLDAALSSFSARDREWLPLMVVAEVELPIARAMLGDVAGAARRLDELVDKCSTLDNPLVNAWVHRARARVALWESDERTFEQHLGEMRRWAELSQHPLLIAQCEALAEQGPRVRRPPRDVEDTGPGPRGTAERRDELVLSTAVERGRLEPVTTTVDTIETRRR